jgi:DUF3015 family protein
MQVFARVGHIVILGGLLLTMEACNTTKATVDTMVKFTQSTTPGELLSADGTVSRERQALVFTAFNFDNLRDDIARGEGEYLRSLGSLLSVPADAQGRFSALTQSRYHVLFPSRNTTPTEMLAALKKEWDAESRPYRTASR